MHGRIHANSHRIHWLNRRQLGHQPANPTLRSLLLAPGSLTRRLRRHCGQALDLEIMAQQWQQPWQEEQQLLELAPGRYTLIREVAMTCADEPWLYARTLLPPQALRGAARRFTTIGRRPLGALLFGAPGRLRIRQLRRDYARLPVHSDYHQRITRLLPVDEVDEWWARRTLYRTSTMRFAIIEVFLSPVVNWGTR